MFQTFTSGSGKKFVEIPVKSEAGFWSRHWIPIDGSFNDLKRQFVSYRHHLLRRITPEDAPAFFQVNAKHLYCEIPKWGRVDKDKLVVPSLIHCSANWVNIRISGKLADGQDIPEGVEAKDLNKQYRRSNY